jgi:hypothetical protein
MFGRTLCVHLSVPGAGFEPARSYGPRRFKFRPNRPASAKPSPRVLIFTGSRPSRAGCPAEYALCSHVPCIFHALRTRAKTSTASELSRRLLSSAPLLRRRSTSHELDLVGVQLERATLVTGSRLGFGHPCAPNRPNATLRRHRRRRLTRNFGSLNRGSSCRAPRARGRRRAPRSRL